MVMILDSGVKTIHHQEMKSTDCNAHVSEESVFVLQEWDLLLKLHDLHKKNNSLQGGTVECSSVKTVSVQCRLSVWDGSSEVDGRQGPSPKPGQTHLKQTCLGMSVTRQHTCTWSSFSKDTDCRCTSKNTFQAQVWGFCLPECLCKGQQKGSAIKSPRERSCPPPSNQHIYSEQSLSEPCITWLHIEVPAIFLLLLSQ